MIVFSSWSDNDDILCDNFTIIIVLQIPHWCIQCNTRFSIISYLHKSGGASNGSEAHNMSSAMASFQSHGYTIYPWCWRVDLISFLCPRFPAPCHCIITQLSVGHHVSTGEAFPHFIKLKNQFKLFLWVWRIDSRDSTTRSLKVAPHSCDVIKVFWKT